MKVLINKIVDMEQKFQVYNVQKGKTIYESFSIENCLIVLRHSHIYRDNTWYTVEGEELIVVDKNDHVVKLGLNL